MKKNILTIVIMAATLVNLVLTIVLVFSVMPAMNKTSNLVDKVASVIDLEIDDASEEEEYTMEDLEPYTITYETEAKINLQLDADKEAHYAVIKGMTISFNKKADDYDDIYKQITATESSNVYVQDIVKEVIGEFSFSTFDQTKVKQESVRRIQEKYNTKCIVDVSLTDPLVA